MSARGHGRPLRFVGAVVLGWIGVRVAMLSPQDAPATPPPASLPIPPSMFRHRSLIVERAPLPVRASSGSTAHSVPFAKPQPAPFSAALVPAAFSLPPDEQASASQIGSTLPRPQPPAAANPAFPPVPLPYHDRWQLSSWLVVRPGRGIGAAPGAGQLGGSQAGFRLAFRPIARRRLAGYARVAGPLRGRGTEAAIGIDWQPLRAPVRLVVEHRVGLDGVRGGPALGVVTGLTESIAPGFRLEAYGQAGAIRRARTERYADGAVRLIGEVVQRRTIRLALGLGAWGAAQREAQRLDLGPTLVATLPIGAAQARLALDWRQRVAGNARPGSGVAITLGSDF